MNKLFSIIRPHLRAFLYATLFTAFLIILTHYTILQFSKISKEIIHSNTLKTQVMSIEITEASQDILLNLFIQYFKNNEELTHSSETKIDSILQQITNTILLQEQGVEGGFFLTYIDDFIGYSYPTSPPPKPIYGPPPRSYTIIKNQIIETIKSQQRITRVHRFDPAVFPLTTTPLIIDGEVIGAIWTRIHIERKLPESKLPHIYSIVSLIAILGFIFAGFVSVFYRNKVQSIHKNLEFLKSGKIVKLPEATGTLGHISQSINLMVENLINENKKRHNLEKALHQEEKMASLGRLVAGVAHEVKTPLAIIKTRIQMWERDIKEQNYSDSLSPLTTDSIQLVVNEIDRLSALVKKLLVYSKSIATKKQKTNINLLIEETLKLVQTGDGENPIKYHINTSNTIPDILIDANAIKEVLINILINAQESIVSNGEIKIESKQEFENCIIKISDNGSGIKEKDLENVFEPFFSTKPLGAGLGLAISYQKIKAHHGTLTLAHNNPNGVICRILLPINYKEEIHDK